MSLIPGLGRSPGGGHSNPLQYSCLEKPMARGAQWATVHGVTKSQTRLKWLSTRAHIVLRSTGCGRAGFTSCRTRAPQSWCRGLAAPQYVGSSWTRDWTRVPHTGRQTPTHCTPREVLPSLLRVWSFSHTCLEYWRVWCYQQLIKKKN